MSGGRGNRRPIIESVRRMTFPIILVSAYDFTVDMFSVSNRVTTISVQVYVNNNMIVFLSNVNGVDFLSSLPRRFWGHKPSVA